MVECWAVWNLGCCLGWEWRAVCLEGLKAGIPWWNAGLSGTAVAHRARKPEFHGGMRGCLEPWVLSGLGVARSLFRGLESRNSMVECWAVWNRSGAQGEKAGVPWWNAGLSGTLGAVWAGSGAQSV